MIKFVATDVDGTLTLRRGDVRISIDAINGIRLLESRGIRVSLISGNSLPVTIGLRGYIGAKGPSVAENGCVIYYHGIRHICKETPPEELRKAALEMGLIESWQNQFRFHDYAFFIPRNVPKEKVADYVNRTDQLASSYGFKVLWSGYALHILPRNAGKVVGMKAAVELLGYSLNETASVGDGENDIDMLKAPAFSACPSDASEKVKNVVNFIASRPGGSGFLEIAKYLLAKNESEMRFLHR
ncbi:MAG: phosphoglycolate phosphatase [Caldisphaeraceae archaeon]|nr:phosphoglycolate phosphatase [Caldisphaeraceae archaeon]MEB2792797.1 phosphoglycolate phosphatase [Caldisphaeraceae archaeon]MEB3691652.1 phosphoglycolate phosphatase [Caldisphaeraceae archaeon]MEB3798040.1 phosphoglycolate phosphatase [Caldisphaeraceae archaeon]